ncbi:MAG: hypothetical protein SFW63_01625 [Alphaproteobacteria bacterium]|nr:hypothetical protein [Alphaproteobacteria bacterium]
MEKAKIAVLTFIRAYESLRRDDGSYLHDASNWRDAASRTEILNALSAHGISIGGFIEQSEDQTLDQINKLQYGQPNPYPTDKALAQKALDELVKEGLVEIKNLVGGNRKNITPAKYRVTEKGKKFELPSVNIGGTQVQYNTKPVQEDVSQASGVSSGVRDKWTGIMSSVRIHLPNDGVTLKPKKGGWEIE